MYQPAETPSVPPDAVLEVVLQRLAACLPPPKRKGRPYAYDRCIVLEAVVYLTPTACTSHTLPSYAVSSRFERQIQLMTSYSIV